MEQANARYHALDSMRASMMLLGIYLHVVVGYSGDGHWPYIDPHPTSVLNWSLGVIHAFRMPAFYSIAGFFGALLWNRRGAASFFRNRGKRILLPFAVFWSLLFPLMAAIVVHLRAAPVQPAPAFTIHYILKRLQPLHLWFLEYLVLLYGLGALVAWLSRWMPAGWIAAIHSAFRATLQKWYAPAVCAVFSWPVLAAMHGGLKDCDGFMPEPLILGAYVVPFTFGWLLYHERDLLPRFEKHLIPYLVAAVPAFFVYGLARNPLMKAAGNVLLCWLLTFATTGLFLRYCSRPSARWRYMSDSSYCLYIMHMPVVVGLQVAFLRVPLPALGKVPLVLAVAVILLVASYDLLVRPTWIGVMLNGRRYERGLPVSGPATDLVPVGQVAVQ
jgi:glucans biosynthesis protein C